MSKVELTREQMVKKLIKDYGKKENDLKTNTDDEIEVMYEQLMDEDDGGMDPDDYIDPEAGDEDMV